MSIASVGAKPNSSLAQKRHRTTENTKTTGQEMTRGGYRSPKRVSVGTERVTMTELRVILVLWNTLLVCTVVFIPAVNISSLNEVEVCVGSIWL